MKAINGLDVLPDQDLFGPLEKFPPPRKLYRPLLSLDIDLDQLEEVDETKGVNLVRAICRERIQAKATGGGFDEKVRCVWTRQCPSCGRSLQKTDPMHPWICECGWRSG